MGIGRGTSVPSVPESSLPAMNLGFVQAYYLRRHLSSHKEALQEKGSLELLVESHTGLGEMVGIRVVACLLCSVTCKGEKELEIHVRKHHQEYPKVETVATVEILKDVEGEQKILEICSSIVKEESESKDCTRDPLRQ